MSKGDIYLPNESGRVDPTIATRSVGMRPKAVAAPSTAAERVVAPFERIRKFVGSRASKPRSSGRSSSR